MLKILRQDKSSYRQLFALAVPILLQNLISSSLGLVDTFMVGMLGQDELAALSLANAPFFVAMLFVFGLQSGGSVLISQYWGKQDITTINRVMGISFYCAGALSFLFASAVFIFPNEIMSITSNNDVLVDIAARYGRVVAYSYFINSVVMVYIGAQRSIENAKFGMIVLGSSMLSNVFFNWVFIFGKLGFPAMGVEGAALGTLLARVVELIIAIIYMIFFDKRLPIKIKAFFMPGVVILRDFIKYATPVVINETLWGLGVSIYPIIYGHMADSSDIVAGFSVAGNIERILAVTCFAIANAAAVIIGKSVGSGESRERVEERGKWLLTLTVVCGFCTAIILVLATVFIAKPFVFPLFNLSPNSQRIAAAMLFTMAGFSIMRFYNTCMIVGVLRGGGDVKYGMYLDVTALYGYAVPIAAISALVLHWDITIVFALLSAEELFKMVGGLARMRSGKWIRNVTREFV